MRIPRIYQAIPLNKGDEIRLDAQATTHVVRVLRLKQSDSIIVFNGQGGEYLARIENVEKRAVSVRLLEWRKVDLESPLRISLVQGVSRGERMDYTLQKSVELGVTDIYPVMTDFTSVKLDAERQQKKHIHWQGVVTSACEQSGRDTVPGVHTVSDLVTCVNKLVNIDTLVLTLNPKATLSFHQVQCAQKQVALVVGPEGGFSHDELSWLSGKGIASVALGPRVLRTETAALAAIAVMQLMWGDYRQAPRATLE